MLAAVERARAQAGAAVLTGGRRLDRPRTRGRLLPGADPARERGAGRRNLDAPSSSARSPASTASATSTRPWRSPTSSPYGLTACIHTRSLHRAIDFTRRVQAGVVVVNGGTYGSEPHMPFGGVKQSGNGSREPGTEALDVYSNLKNVIMTFDPAQT